MHTLRQVSTKKHDLYFVEARLVGMIKIGITQEFEERYPALKAGSPVELTPLLVVAGTARQEWALHARFKEERRHGEWFAASDKLRAFIERLAALDAAGVSAVLRALPSGRMSRKPLGQIAIGWRQSA